MLINHTPFPGISFDHYAADQVMSITTLIRGKFKFHPTHTPNIWELRPDPDQGGLLTQDIYYNDDENDAVRYESDLCPFKPQTDIAFNGYSYSFNKKPQKRWQCGIKVERDDITLLNKQLQVTGIRKWEKIVKPLGWRITTAQATDKVAIRYSNAFGGTYEEIDPDKDEDKLWFKMYEPNPAGNGFFHRKEKTKIHAAPQVEYIDDPITSTKGKHRPASFGFLQRHASPRVDRAGTYDDAWIKNDHPRYPKDFDPLHFQGVAEDQQIKGYLQGDEKIILAYLLPNEKIHTFTLPDYQVFVQYHRKDDEKGNAQEELLAKLELDTVLIDTDSENSEDWRVNLTWRKQIPKYDSITDLETMMIVPESHKDNSDTEVNDELTSRQEHQQETLGGQNG